MRPETVQNCKHRLVFGSSESKNSARSAASGACRRALRACRADQLADFDRLSAAVLWSKPGTRVVPRGESAKADPACPTTCQKTAGLLGGGIISPHWDKRGELQTRQVLQAPRTQSGRPRQRSLRTTRSSSGKTHLVTSSLRTSRTRRPRQQQLGPDSSDGPGD